MSNHKQIIVFATVPFLLLCGVFVFKYRDSVPPAKQTVPHLGTVKEKCRVTRSGLFVDDDLGIRFDIPEGYLVCDASPITLSGKAGREIVLWNSVAFDSADPSSFGFGIAGKVMPGTISDHYKPDELHDTDAGTVAGELVKTATLRSAGCSSNLCPSARVVELQNGDKVLVVEEWKHESGLISSLELISAKQD